MLITTWLKYGKQESLFRRHCELGALLSFHLEFALSPVLGAKEVDAQLALIITSCNRYAHSPFQIGDL